MSDQSDAGSGRNGKIAALSRRVRELERALSDRVEVEKELRESEERCRILLTESPDPTFSFTPDGHYLYVNNAFAQGVGKPVAEIVGKTIWDVFPKDEADKRFAFLSQVFRTGEPKLIEVRVPRPDGDRFYLTTITPVRDAQGSIISAVCSSKDITGRKVTEEALEESRERYRALSEAAFEAIFISENGCGLEQNGAAERMFGYPLEEIVGKPGTNLIAPQDRDQVMHHMLSGFEQPYEVTALRKDGTTFPALIRGKMMHYRGRSVRVTSIRDISEQKQAESTRRESEELLRKLLEHSPISIASVCLDGTIEYINHRAVETFGYLPEDIPTMDLWWRLAYPDEAYRTEVISRWMGLVHKAIAGNGEIERGEYQATCKDGTVKTMVIFGVLISGKVFVMFEDITALKRAAEERLNLERQLLQAQKLESLGILAGGIAHDFNNLLSAILGNADMAFDELPASSDARPLLEQIRTASLRAAELTRQMLAFAGQGELVAHPLDLTATVREMGQLLSASVSKKARLQLDLAAGLPLIEADAAQLRQIVMNFIINASDAIADEQGTIDVRTGRLRDERPFKADFTCGTLPDGPDALFVEVSDSGCGIDPALLPKIFDPFFTTKFAGRGLGLAAAQGIILRHDAALQVKSHPGQGSTFRVVFPVASPARSLPLPPPLAAESGWWGSGIVLLVDDEAPVRIMAARMLAALGFEALVAVDGEEAVEIFRARAGEIRGVLLDLTMPRMDGIETLAALRRANSDVPVILCSGHDVQQSAERRSALRFDGFLQKPFRLEELRRVLRQAVG